MDPEVGTGLRAFHSWGQCGSPLRLPWPSGRVPRVTPCGCATTLLSPGPRSRGENRPGSHAAVTSHRGALPSRLEEGPAVLVQQPQTGARGRSDGTLCSRAPRRLRAVRSRPHAWGASTQSTASNSRRVRLRRAPDSGAPGCGGPQSGEGGTAVPSRACRARAWARYSDLPPDGERPQL